MGYDTTFDGFFSVVPPLAPQHREYLEKFAGTRRMKRLFGSGPVAGFHNAVGLPVGFEGEFFVDGHDGGWGGNDKSVTDINSPPSDQPGLWCQWIPNVRGTAIGGPPLSGTGEKSSTITSSGLNTSWATF